MTIGVDQAAGVLKLKAEGHSGREIARKTGISRATVSKILAGQWQPRQPAAAPGSAVSHGPYRRCRCGFVTRQPCQICRALDAPVQPIDLRAFAAVELGLRGDDVDRYEAVKREKEEVERESRPPESVE